MPKNSDNSAKSMSYLSVDMSYGVSPRPILMNMAVLAILLLSLFLSIQTSYSLLQKIEKPFLRLGVTEELFISPFALLRFQGEQNKSLAWAKIENFEGRKVKNIDAFKSQLGQIDQEKYISLEIETQSSIRKTIHLKMSPLTLLEMINSPLIFVFLALLFLVLAFALYIFRPGLYISFAFTLFMANVGIALSSLVDETFLWTNTSLYAHMMSFLPFTGFLLSGYLSGVLQPEKLVRGRGSRLRLFSILLAWFLFIIGLIVAILHQMSLSDRPRFFIMDGVLYIWVVVGTLITFIVMLYTLKRISSPRQKSRLKQILWSIPIAIGIPVINTVYAKVTGSEGIYMLNFFLLLIPLTIGDSIVRFELFSFNHRSREVIAQIVLLFSISILLTTLLVLMVWYFDIYNRYAIIFTVFISTLAGVPLTLKWYNYINSFLENRRYSSRKILADFNHEITFALDDQQLVEVLRKCLDDSVQPQQFTIVRSQNNGESLKALMADSSLELNEELRKKMMLYASSEFPVEFDSEGMDHMRWVKIVMPLRVSNQLEGILLLGASKSHDLYLSNDLNFISTLNGPLSAALIHVRTFGEIQQLNEDLEQRVQQRTQELESSNSLLLESNQHKDDLVSTVSHDFRSPLAIIRQNIQTILRDFGQMDSEDMKYFLQSISRQESRLSEMSENLLDLAKLKQGSTDFSLIKVDELCRQCMKDVQTVADQKEIDFNLELDSENPSDVYLIWGNALQVKQCLQNLLSNAFKFTAQHGSITLRLYFETQESGDKLILSIQDSGAGIPKESLSRLFEPFYQAENQDEKMQGSGLGLAIVAQIVTGHQAQIDVQSEVSKGTLFTLTFPRYYPQEL